MFYLDTSVLIPYYCPEILSAAADSAIEMSDRFAISALTEVEFCSALSKKFRLNEITEESAKKIIIHFQRHCSDDIYEIIPLETQHLKQACSWISTLTTPLRTNDALHLAVAFTQNYEIVTADKALNASARILGIKCCLIS